VYTVVFIVGDGDEEVTVFVGRERVVGEQRE